MCEGDTLYLMYQVNNVSLVRLEIDTQNKNTVCGYVQIQSIADTSIKSQISGQSTSMLNGCMYVHDIYVL